MEGVKVKLRTDCVDDEQEATRLSTWCTVNELSTSRTWLQLTSSLLSQTIHNQSFYSQIAMMSTDAWSSLEIQSWSSQRLTLHSSFETAKALTFIDFVAISILIVRRPENASLMRKTQKTIDLLVFDGESNGVCLEKHHIFHQHIVFFHASYIGSRLPAINQWVQFQLNCHQQETAKTNVTIKCLLDVLDELNTNLNSEHRQIRIMFELCGIKAQ